MAIKLDPNNTHIFRNTLDSLNACWARLDEMDFDDVADLPISKKEKEAFEQILSLCEAIVYTYEDDIKKHFRN